MDAEHITVVHVKSLEPEPVSAITLYIRNASGGG
jgi:hypothetical protein